VLSKVNNAMNASNMSLLAAKAAALAGDTAKAEAALERATKIWPQNPGVKEFANQVVSRQDTLAQKVPEFDRLMAEAKWREIFNKKLEYALALAQDKERSEQVAQGRAARGEARRQHPEGLDARGPEQPLPGMGCHRGGLQDGVR
jgi:hypothetical protein